MLCLLDFTTYNLHIFSKRCFHVHHRNHLVILLLFPLFTVKIFQADKEQIIEYLLGGVW